MEEHICGTCNGAGCGICHRTGVIQVPDKQDLERMEEMEARKDEAADRDYDLKKSEARSQK